MRLLALAIRLAIWRDAEQNRVLSAQAGRFNKLFRIEGLVWQCIRGGGKEASIVEPITVARELPVQWSTPRIDDQKIKDLYVVKGLTTRETGDALGMSKTGVIRRLHLMGIRRATSNKRKAYAKVPFEVIIMGPSASEIF